MPPTNTQQVQSNSLELQGYLDYYASLGFVVFPLKGKIPIGPKWQFTAYEPFPSVKDFKQHNFGVVLQEDDLVIDIDPRNFKNGVNSITLLKDALKPAELSHTLTIQTGSGGYHLYYKKPVGMPIMKNLPAFPGLDFLSKGCYVVGAGSYHPDTLKEYFIHDRAMLINPAPAKLLDLIQKAQTIVSQAERIPNEKFSDDGQTINRYREYLEKTPGAVEGEAGDHTTYAVAARGHDFGLSPEKTFELLSEYYNPKCVPPWPADQLQSKVNNAYRYAVANLGISSPAHQFSDIKIQETPFQWDRTTAGQYKKDSQLNVVNFLNGALHCPMRGIFAKNLFSQDIVFKKPAPWHKSTDRVFLLDDEQILLFKNYLAETYLFEPKTSALFEAIVVSAYNNSFHPVKDYFNSLEWDQFPRLATWLSKYMGVDDNTYTRSVGLKTLTAAVKRIYEPGCEFDNMLILEGDQGIGKSRAVEILSSPWYSNQKIHIANKDVVSTMFGQLIVEIAEMEAHRKAEVEEMKAFLSCAKDRVRLPYMRIAKDYPRQCIFIGTFNPKKDEDIGYLKDMTGNRRYWPVHCKSIDRDVLYKVKHQLWAEAVHHYKNKTKIYLDDAKIELMAREEQEKRVGFDPWHSKIKEWVNQHEVYKHRLVIKGDEIYTDCLSGKINFYDRRAQTRIADIMERIGWTRGVHYSVERNEPTRGYKRPMIE